MPPGIPGTGETFLKSFLGQETLSPLIGHVGDIGGVRYFIIADHP